MRKRLAHLPPALAVTGIALVVCALVGALSTGRDAAVGGALGAALAAVSFAGSSVVLAWTDIVDRRLIMPVGLLTYVMKFALFGALMYAVTTSGWAGSRAVGWGLMVGTLVWATTQAVWVYRSRIPYVDLTES